MKTRKTQVRLDQVAALIKKAEDAAVSAATDIRDQARRQGSMRISLQAAGITKWLSRAINNLADARGAAGVAQKIAGR